MFGTLIVQFPSHFTGGDLVLRHSTHKPTVIKTCADSHWAVKYTAFYCDVEHELRPVESGYRLAVAYNLVHTDQSGPNGGFKDHSAAVHYSLYRFLNSWRSGVLPAPDDHKMRDGNNNESEEDEDRRARDGVMYDSDDAAASSPIRATDRIGAVVPRKFVYMLDHVYSTAALAFENLKTTDRAVANTLIAFNRYLQTEAPNQIITPVLKAANIPADLISIITEYFGSDESGGFQLVLTRIVKSVYGVEPYDDDPESAEATVELREPFVVQAGGIEHIGGALSGFDSKIELLSSRVAGKSVWRGMEPTDTIDQGHTGNDGATVDLHYRRCALVVWPTDRTVQLYGAARTGFPPALRFVAGRLDSEIKAMTKRVSTAVCDLVRQLLSLSACAFDEANLIAVIGQLIRPAYKIGDRTSARQFLRLLLKSPLLQWNRDAALTAKSGAALATIALVCRYDALLSPIID